MANKPDMAELLARLRAKTSTTSQHDNLARPVPTAEDVPSEPFKLQEGPSTGRTPPPHTPPHHQLPATSELDAPGLSPLQVALAALKKDYGGGRSQPTVPTPAASSKAAALIAQAKARQQEQARTAQIAQDRAMTEKLLAIVPEAGHVMVPTPVPAPTAAEIVRDAWNNIEAKESRLDSIVYNAEQLQFVELASSGKSCVLIGPAGTGKTTCMRGVTSELIKSGLAGVIGENDHKILEGRKGAPGIVICAFTRRAVANIRKNLPAELRGNCMTIHKLLEFEPVEKEDLDEKGNPRTRKVFEPQRNLGNPLPSCIHTIIIEESSMVGGSPFPQDNFLLYNMLKEACQHQVQEIFLGDIQQLPPVFGPAILGFKMLELPTVELTQVYRQALESPIIRLAHGILKGLPIAASKFKEFEEPEKLHFHVWKKKLEGDVAARHLGKFFCQQYDEGKYNPEEDAILIPFNVSCGCIEINKAIATHIAHKEGRLVYEIVSGKGDVYFSVGDRVLIDREEAVITKIEPNPDYFGKPFAAPSTTMNYWGYDPKKKMESTEFDIDTYLDSLAEDGEKKRQASHIIYYKRPDVEAEFKLSGAGDVNNMLLAYALTVHKSQGSEWRKVYLCFHHSHASMLMRELLYTGVTRAKEFLYIVCETDTFVKGVTAQKIPGNTWQEKAEYFKGKQPGGVDVSPLLRKKPK